MKFKKLTTAPLQRAKRQVFGGFGSYGYPAASFGGFYGAAVATAVPAVAVTPAVNVHTNVVNPPVVNTVCLTLFIF